MTNKEIKYILEEDSTPSNAVDVHYMSPEEIEGPGKIPTEVPKSDGREVFHDNDEENNKEKNSQSNLFNSFGSQKISDEPDNDISSSSPDVQPNYTPMDAINQIKADPANVIVARYKDNNYVHHDDLKNYMNASDTRDYDTAVKNIIDSNDDESLYNNGLKIVMSRSEFDNCSEEEKANLEAASVEFEIYNN